MSQLLPAYKNATHIFSEKEGITSSNFTHASYELDNGALLIKSYQGPFQILHNNYTVTLPNTKPEIKGNPTNIAAVIKMGSNNYWVFAENQVIMIKGNSIYNIFNASYQFGSNVYQVHTGKVISIIRDYKEDKHFLALFDGSKLRILQSFNHYADIIKGSDNSIYLTNHDNNRLNIYSLNQHTFQKTDSISYPKKYFCNFENSGNLTFQEEDNKAFTEIRNGKIYKYYRLNFRELVSMDVRAIIDNKVLLNHNNGLKAVINFTDKPACPLVLTTDGAQATHFTYNIATGSYYVHTGTVLMRVFPYLRVYPRMFNGSHSNNIFTIQQDDKGSIWTGSYDKYLSKLDNNKIIESNLHKYKFMNGGLCYGKYIFLISENENYGGILKFNSTSKNPENVTRIIDSATGFYLYTDSINVYFGTSAKGLWFCSLSDFLFKKIPEWEKITYNDGMQLYNILTITSDNKQRIWLGHPKRGISVYYIKSKKARTFLIENKEIDFGAMCSLTDNDGVVWLGTFQKGLVYYDDKDGDSINIKNFINIHHPLLHEAKITFIKQWKSYLIIGATDKILLFDLDAWKTKHEVKVRYLTAMETNFTSTTEQNAVIIDKCDSAVWFSTSDMLYKWDIEPWLKLQTYRTKPTILINNKLADKDNSFNFMYNQNSLQIKLQYATPDNLPRYSAMSLAKKGDSIIMPAPNLENTLNFANLKSDNYVLVVQICEADGTVANYLYSIQIDEIFYKKWWFIVLNLVVITGVIYFWLNYRKQQERIRKELNHLRAITLSNQFKPHLLLNSFQAVQAEVFENPYAKLIIDNLGENVNIIFRRNHTNRITHSFTDEWILVLNTIELFKTIYIKELNPILPDMVVINNISQLIPLCLLQVPVENALGHGLANKQSGPYFFEITIITNYNKIIITIIDNGVGRTNAQKINKLKKHGSGLSNIEKMISILNKFNANKLTFEIVDNIFPEENDSGTKIIITIPLNYNYEFE